ncbi:hypothetical protein SAMN04487989_104103 [Bizionia echini]|uniref:Uncharacterized protein n=1 Tax=Bizionia echini TaxID=649333 RepID=A0A1I5BZU3_9FLAO|nr:hypothetical protein [Bizionia echini]SFN80280.1 hypothetical protein SAMN04487989_104103 [Bizionia echini]
MKQTLHYQFKRRSKNHLDWLINVIKSEKYFQADSIILTNNQTNRFSRNLKSA